MKSKVVPSCSPVFVLVGPLAEAKKLTRWAHEEFRKSAVVAFIGVDAGFQVLFDSGLPPTLLIGDLDGLKNPELAEMTPTLKLPRVKERSDLSFALKFCSEQKASVLYAYGFQGGRADHEFGVHLDLSEASVRIPRVVSIGERGVTFYLSAKYASEKSPFRIAKKDLIALRATFDSSNSHRSSAKPSLQKWISLFPTEGTARGVMVRGLRFPVLNGILSSSSQGLSNEIRSSEIEVSLRKGRVALFFPTER